MRTSSVLELVLAEIDELPGSCRLSALGVTTPEVNIKKINNRKIMSVSDETLNSDIGLVRFLTPIS